VVERERFSVVYGLYGHGLGQSLHEAPLIPHYVLSKEREHLDRKLVPGMVITIEPMITAGSRKTKVLRDGWTIVTNDGSRSAQFEHTVAITNNGPWVLSLP
jgi:methionyl aminopeptidase